MNRCKMCARSTYGVWVENKGEMNKNYCSLPCVIQAKQYFKSEFDDLKVKEVVDFLEMINGLGFSLKDMLYG